MTRWSGKQYNAYMARAGKASKYNGVHLCVTCKHAYGDDCFGVPREQRGWVVKREDGGRVVKCKKYEKGRKPLVVRPKWCRLYAKFFGEEGMHEGY